MKDDYIRSNRGGVGRSVGKATDLAETSKTE